MTTSVAGNAMITRYCPASHQIKNTQFIRHSPYLTLIFPHQWSMNLVYDNPLKDLSLIQRLNEFIFAVRIPAVSSLPHPCNNIPYALRPLQRSQHR